MLLGPKSLGKQRISGFPESRLQRHHLTVVPLFYALQLTLFRKGFISAYQCTRIVVQQFAGRVVQRERCELIGVRYAQHLNITRANIGKRCAAIDAEHGIRIGATHQAQMRAERFAPACRGEAKHGGDIVQALNLDRR